MTKVKVSTAWLSGCSGCHMSLLNLDEAIVDLVRKVEFVRSPIMDGKEFPQCDVGIVEGAVSDRDNLEVLLKLRESCSILVALGDCAVFGGMTAMRNLFDVEDVEERGYVGTETTVGGKVPHGDHVPELLPQATGLNAWVKVDYYIPGCPPSPESIIHVISSLVEGREAKLPKELIHFDSRIKRRQ